MTVMGHVRKSLSHSGSKGDSPHLIQEEIELLREDK